MFGCRGTFPVDFACAGLGQRVSSGMHTSLPVIDGHNDTILDLHESERGEGRSFFERSSRGHLDLPRAIEGGFAGGFFAFFVPGPEGEATEDADSRTRPLPPAITHAEALPYTVALAARLLRIERESAGRLRIVRCVADLQQALADGAIAAIMHIEGAEAIDTDLNALELFHAAGLRSLGLVWSRANDFAEGVPFRFPSSPDTGPGLTDAGRRLVQRCNELGILVDLSHLNQRGFEDVAALSTAPLVATHSNAHAICPSSRNLTDAQIDAIGATGGVIGVNYYVGFTRADGASEADTPLDAYVAHARYIADRIGIEHVALGSDFDGAKVARDLGDAAGLPRLLEAFRAAGFDEASLALITSSNWLRVLEATWGA